MILDSHGNVKFNFISHREGGGVQLVFKAIIFVMYILYF
jgi:hypothetical protein